MTEQFLTREDQMRLSITKWMAITSWALPLINFIGISINIIISINSDILWDLGIDGETNALFSFGYLLFSQLAGLSLAIVSRRRSFREHNGRYSGHGFAGICLSFPFLFTYTYSFIILAHEIIH